MDIAITTNNSNMPKLSRLVPCLFDSNLIASSETQGLLAAMMQYFWVKVYFKS